MWTDQKHSLFLQHLELSFVKQLHQSIGNSKRIRMKRPTVSAHTPEPWRLCKAENAGEVVKPNGSDTCSHQFCATTRYCDLHDSQREGTGQNFVDEGNQAKSHTEYREKRRKTVLAD